MRLGRFVLSLSPGPTQPSHAARIRQFAQMWRISNDIWDSWHFVHEPPREDDFAIGVRDIFDRLQPRVGHARDGRWPDADMLPFGMLAPHPGWGEARHGWLTLDEECTRLMWNGQRTADSDRLKVELPALGCVLYALHTPAG